MADLQVVVFGLNNELCGVESSQVREIEKYRETSRVPRMPKFVDGLLNLRGRAVPVINLNRRLELGETEISKKTKVIITEIEGNPAGFIVNDVYEIAKFTDDEVEAAPSFISEAGNEYLKYVAKKDEKIISILDFNKILTGKEAARLKSLNREA